MYFFNVVLFCFLFLQILGRPTHVLQDYDKDSKENSYRDSDSGDSDDYEQNVQKSSMKQFAGNDVAPGAELPDENGSSSNIDHALPDKDYLENNEDQAGAAQLSPSDISMSNDIKRTAAYSNGVILFHENLKPRNKEYTEDDSVGANQQSKFIKKYNTVSKVERDASHRDRRQIKNDYLNEPAGTEKISTQKNELTGNEDEEKAIRRHVKKLSKKELNELLNSLSDDKKTLLRNIIDNCQQEYETINKREITKKAGANGENSFVGNEQSDTSKIQGGSANLEAESSMAPDFEKQDNTKKTDDSMYSKSTEIANSSEKSSDKINVLDSIAVDNKLLRSEKLESLGSSNIESNILEHSNSEDGTLKKENKRETDTKPFVHSESIIEEPFNVKSSNKEDLYCSENDELSQLWNEESSLYNSNKYKREACPSDTDSIKSLEDSFPKANIPSNFKPGSDLAPLVRVKRNNPDKSVEKRDTNVLSNIKVPYFSSALENNEEGSDEGGEFEDDGFFDRGANFVKSAEVVKPSTDFDNEENNAKYSQQTHVAKNNIETDTVGLGSDTDVVLSGIEGVDDNLMYNNVARIRRTGDAFDNLNMESKQQINSQHEDNEISGECNNVVRYQENDAFGSLPRNYEQDLGRYKRIRRLKPANNVPAST